MQVHEVMKKFTIGDGEEILINTLKSKGSHIIDDLTNKSFLDCSSQFASLPIGWNHDKLINSQGDLGRAALHKISNSDYYTVELANFVEKFASFVPDFQHLFFIEGGALAVENGLKAAFDWKLKKLGYKENAPEDIVRNLDVIHLQQAFHGRSGYTLSLTNTVSNKTALFPKFNWTRIKNPKLKFPLIEDESIAEEEFSLCQAEVALKSGWVAAIILETIQGEGGDNYFSPSYFAAIRALADKYEAMLILDEIQVGGGITGKMWAYEHFGIIPDMIIFGKKTQVCGFASTNRIDDVPDNVFHTPSRINSTWGGSICDMVRFTFIADIILQENLLQNSEIVGKYFLEQLQQLPVITNTRGLGLMLAFDLVDATTRNSVLATLLKKMTVLPCGERSIRLRPSLIFSIQDADEAISYIKEAVEIL